MITVPELAADALGDFLGHYMRRRYGSSQNQLVEMVPSIARIALECIGNSDALYHNVEHTMLVTMAGHDILRGRALHNHMPAEDYAHIIIACLTHDIGYVRGLFRGDNQDGYVVDADGRKAALPRGSSDAAMLPYHVDRSKMYVMERLHGIEILDRERIARAIEGTRFPASLPSEDEECDDEAALLRAADLSGKSATPIISARRTRCFTSLKRPGSTVSSAIVRRRISSISIPSSTGIWWRPTCRRLFAISM